MRKTLFFFIDFSLDLCLKNEHLIEALLNFAKFFEIHFDRNL